MVKKTGNLQVPREKKRIAKGSGDRVRRFFNRVKSTPFHPQWIAIRNEEKELKAIARPFQGCVLEIGSGNRRLEKYLSFQIRYISLDYPPSGKRYEQNPHVWGDASHLPFRNDTLDGTALLEVLEHLPTPQIAFQEISRVLKPGGVGVITTPFLYPIHDAPYDFGRLTSYQFIRLAKEAGLEITLIEERGRPLETAGLLASLALAKTALQALEQRSLSGLVFLPAMLLLFILTYWAGLCPAF